MKDYKRLTKWSELGTLHVFDINGKEIPLCDVSPIDSDSLAGRLADLEDKIERGELVDRNGYINRLMMAKDISGLTDKEIEFFAKHNARVRENADAEIARLTAENERLRTENAELIKSDTSKEHCIIEEHNEVHYWRDRAKQAEEDVYLREKEIIELNASLSKMETVEKELRERLEKAVEE